MVKVFHSGQSIFNFYQSYQSAALNVFSKLFLHFPILVIFTLKRVLFIFCWKKNVFITFLHLPIYFDFFFSFSFLLIFDKLNYRSNMSNDVHVHCYNTIRMCMIKITCIYKFVNNCNCTHNNWENCEYE